MIVLPRGKSCSNFFLLIQTFSFIRNILWHVYYFVLKMTLKIDQQHCWQKKGTRTFVQFQPWKISRLRTSFDMFLLLFLFVQLVTEKIPFGPRNTKKVWNCSCWLDCLAFLCLFSVCVINYNHKPTKILGIFWNLLTIIALRRNCQRRFNSQALSRYRAHTYACRNFDRNFRNRSS